MLINWFCQECIELNEFNRSPQKCDDCENYAESFNESLWEYENEK